MGVWRMKRSHAIYATPGSERPQARLRAIDEGANRDTGLPIEMLPWICLCSSPLELNLVGEMGSMPNCE